MPAMLRTGLAALALCAGTAGAAQDQIVLHSPWLGLRVEQGGQEVRLDYTGLLTTEIHLESRPFTLVLPVRSDDDVYQMTAWIDDSIFTNANPQTRARAWEDSDLPFYFGPYTAGADTSASSGTLFLNDESHHYLRGLRLGPDRDRHVFHVSRLLHEREDYPVSQQSGPLYLVLWYDEDGDEAMDHGEYEFLILHFDGAAD